MQLRIKNLCGLTLLCISTIALADDPTFDTMTETQIAQYCAAGHGGTPEIEYCANHEFEKEDRKLNASYSQVVAQIKTNSSDKSILSQLVKAQRLWVAFRDAECGAHYTYYIDGTIRGLMFVSCKTELTEQREKDLRSFYLSTN
jgi:uncharacterized protein YecT (DUF1311 family)